MHITILLLTALLTTNATAETRHAEAHVHGINHVQIILNGSTLQVTYEFPVAQLNEKKHDEHKHDEHKHDEHKHDELTERLKEIKNIATLVAIPDSARCSQSRIKHDLRAVSSTGSDDSHTNHQDAILETVLECQNPYALNSVDFSPAFSRFEDVKKILVEGMLGSQSLSDTVTAKKAVMSF
ncbi:MAG: ZrgA family zinc uptake protein [Litorivicinaceae bacterium]